MFTKLHVENFLSLKNVDIELGKVNVFIGPNASGKSNIARALQLIAKHARDGLPILEGYERLRDLSFNFNPAVDVYIALETLIGRAKYGYTLQLTNDGYFEQILMANAPVITHDGSGSAINVKGQTRHGLTFHRGSAYYGRPIFGGMLTVLPSDIEREVHHLASSLGKISVHSFAPDMLRLKNSVSEPPS